MSLQFIIGNSGAGSLETAEGNAENRKILQGLPEGDS